MSSARKSRWTTRVRELANRVLAPLNLRLETLTAVRKEAARLRKLEEAGLFDGPRFTVPESFRRTDPAPLLEIVAASRDRFDTLEHAEDNPFGYAFENSYFSSPDAEVYYAVVRRYRPRTILEIGSGHSTRIARQAIADAGLDARLTAIDPSPRISLAGIVDEHVPSSVESEANRERYRSLSANDVLFIDSSHEIRTANDVVFLYLEVLPELAPGVIVHIHDIFLPFDYPREWLLERGWQWNEQYLVHAILAFGDRFEVIWPGRFLQHTMPGFDRAFPHARGRLAASVWLRTRTTTRNA